MKFIKKQGLSMGRNIGPRSTKPKVKRGDTKKRTIPMEEQDAMKYLGYSHQEMEAMAAEKRKD